MSKYGIFENNNELHFIAESDNEKDLILRLNGSCRAKVFTDTQFNDAGNYKKNFKLDNNDNIIEEDLAESIFSSADSVDQAIVDVEFYKNFWVKRINNVLHKLSAEDQTTWTTFKQKLEAIDLNTASITYPPGKTFMEWFSEQEGVPAKKALQIPKL
jgi:hypothetical protein